jgi:hypothetical protein
MLKILFLFLPSILSLFYTRSSLLNHVAIASDTCVFSPNDIADDLLSRYAAFVLCEIVRVHLTNEDDYFIHPPLGDDITSTTSDISLCAQKVYASNVAHYVLDFLHLSFNYGSDRVMDFYYQPCFNTTLIPSAQPTTLKPTSTPSISPTFNPTVKPTAMPSTKPSALPTITPTSSPTFDAFNCCSADITTCTSVCSLNGGVQYCFSSPDNCSLLDCYCNNGFVGHFTPSVGCNYCYIYEPCCTPDQNACYIYCGSISATFQDCEDSTTGTYGCECFGHATVFNPSLCIPSASPTPSPTPIPSTAKPSVIPSSSPTITPTVATPTFNPTVTPTTMPTNPCATYGMNCNSQELADCTFYCASGHGGYNGVCVNVGYIHGDPEVLYCMCVDGEHDITVYDTYFC